MRDHMLALIRRETEHCQMVSGRIVAKMNALVDPQIIATLRSLTRRGRLT